MKFFQVLSVAAFTGSVLAAPQWAPWMNKCLKQSDAEDIVGKFITVLSHTNIAAANATAQALFTDDYTENSDSILSLEGQPLGGNTFVGKQVYINGVLGAPPVTGINTLYVAPAGCEKIIWYWKFTGIGSKEYEVKGFNLFTITDAMQVQMINVEFNSIAWGLDTGYQIVFPPGGGAPTKQ